MSYLYYLDILYIRSKGHNFTKGAKINFKYKIFGLGLSSEDNVSLFFSEQTDLDEKKVKVVYLQEMMMGNAENQLGKFLLEIFQMLSL